MSILKTYAQTFGLTLSDQQISAFDVLTKGLTARSKELNLTAIKEQKQIEIKHYTDSLALFAALAVPLNATLLDVGTGGGFPALPIGIYRPDIAVFGLDSTEKKLLFVKEMAEKLSLNLNLLYGRAEVIAHQEEYRENFDVVTSRGVSDMTALCEICLPFVKVGGTFAAYKGPNAKEELDRAQNTIEKMGGAVERLYKYTLPEVEGDRCIIVIKKVSSTPASFPRSWAAIKKANK